MLIAIGNPLPYGAHLQHNTVNFSIYAPQAKLLEIHFYSSEFKRLQIVKFDRKIHCIGSIWHIRIKNPPSLLYTYYINGQQHIIDPYCKEVIKCPARTPSMISVIIPETPFDWQETQRPSRPFKDLMIYEMHLRGYTQDPSSQVKHPGTYLGLIERIPHLLELGINAIELMPIFEFNELEYYQCEIQRKSTLINYWGYSPLCFFAPASGYATSKDAGKPTEEFKTMVRELHRHDIEIILDVVYTHTGEGDRNGSTYSFRALDESSYYHINKDGTYRDYSGCGNSLNTNNAITKNLILDSMRYWVGEMGVDGFRFDLASIFNRNQEGEAHHISDLIQSINSDPLLSSIKLIAEPWDAVGLYQAGIFASEYNAWLEWNGRYRDEMRSFIKGTQIGLYNFAMRLSGSEDLYGTHCTNSRSINFVTCHDGFTLYDLVSYMQKHNIDNGENNRDGSNNNISWNCGAEGETLDSSVQALRERQMRNFILALMISKGVPMIHMGDEYGHTKEGNNNTWCQDNRLNWFLWNQQERHPQRLAFMKQCIQLRKRFSLLTKSTFYKPEELTWHGANSHEPDWFHGMNYLAMYLKDETNKQYLYIGFNMTSNPLKILVPESKAGTQWTWLINTMEDQFGELNFLELSLPPFTTIVLEAKLFTK